ncbi:MAG: hypothetical protein AAFX57_11830 [Bacteroidota bacterium]
MKKSLRQTHAKLQLSLLCSQAQAETQVRTLMFLNALKQNIDKLTLTKFSPNSPSATLVISDRWPKLQSLLVDFLELKLPTTNSRKFKLLYQMLQTATLAVSNHKL